MASRHPVDQQEDAVECLDDLTPTSSLLNIQVTVDNTEDEDDLRVVGMDLYKIKEEQLRYRLHKEYLEKYSAEELIPLGLQIPILPKVNRRRELFKAKWCAKMHEFSKVMMGMLTEYYDEEPVLMDEEIKEIEKKMKALWSQEEEDIFRNDLTEILKEDEEAISKTKEKKLKNDRLKYRNRVNKDSNPPKLPQKMSPTL